MRRTRRVNPTAELEPTDVDGERDYHDTDSFGRDDLPLVAKLADRAHTFIFVRLLELKAEAKGE